MRRRSRQRSAGALSRCEITLVHTDGCRGCAGEMSETCVVISRYFAILYIKGTLPPHISVDSEPAYKVLLRLRLKREEKRKKRKAAGSPLSEPLSVRSVPSVVDTEAT